MKTLTFILSLVIASVTLAEEPAVADKEPDINDPKILAEILEGAADGAKLQERGKKGEELSYLPNTETPFTGWTKSMHDNGQVKSAVQYKGGKMHGVAALWYKNGQKRMASNNKDGKEHGVITVWHENGQKDMEVHHRNGKIHGSYTSWHENGQKQQEEFYEEDKLHGTKVLWHKDGSIKERGEFKNGVLISKNGVAVENLDAGKWQFQESSDAVTDKTIKLAVLEAEREVDITLNVKPSLIFRKTGNRLDAIINVGTRVSPSNVLSDYMPTTLRMDKNKPVNRRWFLSTTKQAFFHPDPKLLARVLTETDTMLIRFQPYGHGNITVEFDVRGFDEIYKKF